jgi:hypothetical protein
MRIVHHSVQEQISKVSALNVNVSRSNIGKDDLVLSQTPRCGLYKKHTKMLQRQ